MAVHFRSVGAEDAGRVEPIVDGVGDRLSDTAEVHRFLKQLTAHIPDRKMGDRGRHQEA
ncbi:MAG: hypothetical protein QNJ30_27515 [Kiloniellales bacterium]|nr:hypothetical protein [Kiloniellales bacterium]